ncbi:hypothetical protein DSM106972_034460 [Dulcicalothrix desertica PCC 7102]|uniref:DyP dimeric alpha+beta barrel domain-containing protein n=1 Tax=Dulcicalothrix desertica PCC 7102 TaxID=232991 RepID=A0A3S5K3B8_9CYAN|nr:hypothetical protein [Dulcicalothrix desertica]RUT06240.1 hypothetical protein DSM106972_034460 [Dulcicalothrix desertica PCC 7102]TWH54098.1 hypothetical protein CAL7102_02104 [Dulcicalothrix desertica PCC 7102]
MTFTDTEEARRWLTDIIPEVATVKEVQAFNNLFKLVNKRRRGELGTVSSTWKNVAFTHSGFEALGISSQDLNSFPKVFKAGMKARATTRRIYTFPGLRDVETVLIRSLHYFTANASNNRLTTRPSGNW